MNGHSRSFVIEPGFQTFAPLTFDMFAEGLCGIISTGNDIGTY